MDQANRQEFVIRTYSQPYGPARLRAVTAKPEIDRFQKFIVDLAQRFTNSPEEAEAALKEMNEDIERCSGPDKQPPTIEGRLLSGIALRRLIKFLQ